MSEQVEGKVWASLQYRNRESQSEQQIEVQAFAEGTVPARVKVSQGLTINMGNYESARIDAGVELPCYVEEVSDAFERAYAICGEQLQAQVSEIRAEPKPGSRG